MELSYHKLLLSTMHMVTCAKGDPDRITDETLLQALTVNENLHALGFTLRPQDIGMLAASSSMQEFYQQVKELVPEVKAEPMYPDFPIQVMEIDEAQFRLHQMMHYFSTYGLEWLTGQKVSKGWLPNVTSTPKTEKDDRLLEDTVLELVWEEDSRGLCLRRILGRRERLTIPEKELVLMSLPHVSEETFDGMKILFKENLELLFPDIVAKTPGKEAVRILGHLCQHTGDVLNNAAILLKKNRYHLRTAQKRMLVHLLESYPASDLRGNLILSNTKRERNLLILRHLDYNIYSRSAAHKKAVADLRAGSLHSWEGTAKRMLTGHEEGALAFTAKRPGVVLRMLQWILSLSYDEEEITGLLCAQAEKLSTQMLVKLLHTVRVETEEGIRKEEEKAFREIEVRFRQRKWPYINLHSKLENEVRWERWRHQSAMSRCGNQLSANLHAWSEPVLSRKCRKEISKIMEKLEQQAGVLVQGQKSRALALEKSIRKIQRRILFLEGTVRAHRDGREGTGRCAENAQRLIVSLESDKRRMQEKLSALQAEIDGHIQMALSENKVEEIKADIIKKYDLLRERAGAETLALSEASARKMEELEAAHRERLARIEEKYALLRASAPSALIAIEEEEAAEKVKAAARFERRVRALHSIPARKRILERVLQAHLETVTTPLKGRKVWLDPGPFDLAHSLMQTTDKSQDGTYVRSGFAWRIPEKARRVRFFVYWNDESRVDIDLHASAADYPVGKPDLLSWFHVGWNAGFRERGVCHSGDITHSDAAEYIDIDLSQNLRYVTLNVDLFDGHNGFRDIDECFVGLMAVKKYKENVRLYDPANCFFTHDLMQDTRFLNYGYIDVLNRYVRFVGKPFTRDFASHLDRDHDASFYVQEYLDILFKAQGAVPVQTQEEADLVLTVGKSTIPGAVSLIDNNFFLDAQ